MPLLRLYPLTPDPIANSRSQELTFDPNYRRYFGGKECVEAFRSGVSQTSALVAKKDFAKLKTDFLICEEPQDEKDIWVFETAVMGYVQVRGGKLHPSQR